MPCFHPLTIFRSLDFDEAGKYEYSFKLSERCSYPMKIPCGQCIGCRLEYSRQWAIRCCLEAKYHAHTWFVTLTYSDEFLPIRDHCKVDPDSGEVVFSEHVASLDYRDVTLFLKRLRQDLVRKEKPAIRYYGCGDYGTKGGRPHYHLIIFGLELEDLRFCSWQRISESGYPLFESDYVTNLWGKGLVAIGEFNFDTAAYTARYVTHKQTGRKKDYYDNLGIEPIKSLCSRRPGIAAQYASDNSDKILKYDSVVVVRADGAGYSVKPPQYFDRLFDSIPGLSDSSNQNKRKRISEGEEKSRMLKKAIKSKDILGQVSVINPLYDEYLIKAQDAVIARTKALKRSLE